MDNQTTIGTESDNGVRAKATDALNTVRERAGEQIESRINDGKTRAADKVSGVAQTLLTTSQSLRDQGQGDYSQYIDRAADQVDRLANYLQSADVHDVVDRVEGFARRSPGAFIAGAVAVGFLASRFLKASRPEMGYDSGYRSNSFGSNSLNSNNFGSTGYGTGYDTGIERSGSYDAGRSGLGASNPSRMESWRTSGYAASERSSDSVANPGTPGSTGFESSAANNVARTSEPNRTIDNSSVTGTGTNRTGTNTDSGSSSSSDRGI